MWYHFLRIQDSELEIAST